MANKENIRIFVVEDHLIMREGLCMVLSQEKNWEICGVADDVNTALAEISKKKPHLVIIDISLKESNGLDLVKALQGRKEKPRILVLSMHSETVYAQRALKAGADGYIMKHEDNKTFLDAVSKILEGKIYVSEGVSQAMLQLSTQRKHKVEGGPVELLSDRELEVFEMIGKGWGTKKISESLYLSVKTVATYRDRIKEKLNLGSTAELIELAVQWEKNRSQ